MFIHLIPFPRKDINKTNSRCNLAINMFYKHIPCEHVVRYNQGRNPSVSGLERRGEDIWSGNCALWPKRESEMNLWVTLALIFVYLTVHFKSDRDGCLSLDKYFPGHGKHVIHLHLSICILTFTHAVTRRITLRKPSCRAKSFPLVATTYIYTLSSD